MIHRKGTKGNDRSWPAAQNGRFHSRDGENQVSRVFRHLRAMAIVARCQRANWRVALCLIDQMVANI